MPPMTALPPLMTRSECILSLIEVCVVVRGVGPVVVSENYIVSEESRRDEG